MNYSDTKVICSICKRPPDGTYTVDENILPCGHHCDNLIEVVAVDVDLLAAAEALAVVAEQYSEAVQPHLYNDGGWKLHEALQAALRQYREAK